MTRTGRDTRRQPHPLRPLRRAVRAGLQPGHADRRARRPRGALRPPGRARRARSSPAPCSSTAATSTSPARPCSARGSTHDTPAYDVQQACDTGLQTALAVANKIALGTIDWGIAGGVDTTSDAPIGVNEDLRQILLEANRRKGAGRLKLLGHLRPGQIVPSIPRNAEPRTGLSMGEHQAITTERYGDRPRGAGRARRRQPPGPGRRVRARLHGRPRHALPRARRATRTCAPTRAPTSSRSSSRCSATR